VESFEPLSIVAQTTAACDKLTQPPPRSQG